MYLCHALLLCRCILIGRLRHYSRTRTVYPLDIYTIFGTLTIYTSVPSARTAQSALDPISRGNHGFTCAFRRTFLRPSGGVLDDDVPRPPRMIHAGQRRMRSSTRRRRRRRALAPSFSFREHHCHSHETRAERPTQALVPGRPISSALNWLPFRPASHSLVPRRCMHLDRNPRLRMRGPQLHLHPMYLRLRYRSPRMLAATMPRRIVVLIIRPPHFAFSSPSSHMLRDAPRRSSSCVRHQLLQSRFPDDLPLKEAAAGGVGKCSRGSCGRPAAMSVSSNL